MFWCDSAAVFIKASSVLSYLLLPHVHAISPYVMMSLGHCGFCCQHLKLNEQKPGPGNFFQPRFGANRVLSDRRTASNAVKSLDCAEPPPSASLSKMHLLVPGLVVSTGNPIQTCQDMPSMQGSNQILFACQRSHGPHRPHQNGKNRTFPQSPPWSSLHQVLRPTDPSACWRTVPIA